MNPIESERFVAEDLEPVRRPPAALRLLVMIGLSLILWMLLWAGARLLWG